jgi:hypothetical protein
LYAAKRVVGRSPAAGRKAGTTITGTTTASVSAAVNVSKKKLEGLFADELATLQPTPGNMRLVKDRVLYVWQQLTSEAKDRAAERERGVKAIQQKLDRLDEAYLFAQTIDLTSYERQRDKLREEAGAFARIGLLTSSRQGYCEPAAAAGNPYLAVASTSCGRANSAAIFHCPSSFFHTRKTDEVVTSRPPLFRSKLRSELLNS